MTYAFTVRVQRSAPPHYDNLDHYVFTVSAPNAETAITKAVRQARKDSGFKRVWTCVSLERGGWIL